ncbi:ComEA family DNA-binding protein [Paenibacillus cremeus]|uniref:ComEA family DNA-binding protein n=1 Tax=Paenibacillus cremeus TaxID=2163881 RepID=UPI0021BD26EC|nr:helix-hairpin-helix domain-containing protein [Paenibacillus cremeus]
MNIAAVVMIGCLCALLFWQPWEPAEEMAGWKNANEDMLAMLQEQEARKAVKAPETAPEAVSKPEPKRGAELSAKPEPDVKQAPSVKINLNTATAQQLDALPGIGASRAQAIIAMRQQLGGRFQSVNQLLEVKGIGEKSLEQLSQLLTVEP